MQGINPASIFDARLTPVWVIFVLFLGFLSMILRAENEQRKSPEPLISMASGIVRPAGFEPVTFRVGV